MIEQNLGWFFFFFLLPDKPFVEKYIIFLVLAGKSSYLTVTYWKIAIVQLVTWPRVIWWNQNPGAQECLHWACLQTHSTWTFLTFTEDKGTWLKTEKEHFRGRSLLVLVTATSCFLLGWTELSSGVGFMAGKNGKSCLSEFTDQLQTQAMGFLRKFHVLSMFQPADCNMNSLP